MGLVSRAFARLLVAIANRVDNRVEPRPDFPPALRDLKRYQEGEALADRWRAPSMADEVDAMRAEQERDVISTIRKPRG